MTAYMRTASGRIAREIAAMPSMAVAVQELEPSAALEADGGIGRSRTAGEDHRACKTARFGLALGNS